MKAAAKKILFISYNYPPIADVGMIKTLKFTKYVHEFGWTSYVISVKNPDVWRLRGDEKVPEGVTVAYTRNIVRLDLLGNAIKKIFESRKKRESQRLTSPKKVEAGLGSRSTIVPDFMIGWLPLTLTTALRLIRREKIDAVYIACPPFTPAIIGALIKKLAKVPVVVCFEDAWVFNPDSKYPTKLHEYADKKLERFVVGTADKVIHVTENTKKRYLAAYPMAQEKHTVIFNGFDLDDLPKETVEKFPIFTIAYTGTFYYHNNPEKIFAALRELIDGGSIAKNEVQFLFAGRKDAFVDSLIKKYAMDDVVNYVGYVTLKEMMLYLFKAHLLFLVLTERHKDVLTDKVFSYLASGTPILATVPLGGECAQLIAAYSDTSYIADTNDGEAIKRALLDAYERWRVEKSARNAPTQRTLEFRKKFNRKAQTNELITLIEALL